VNNVYVGLKGAVMQAYLDGLAVGSDTPKQHVVDARRVLERSRDANMRLKLAKCKFGKNEVELLGHKVRFKEERPNDWHRYCLQRFEEPTKLTEVLRFLGLLQFFKACVDHLAELAAAALRRLGCNAVKQTQKVTRDNTTRELGATVGAGAERIVRESARCPCRPVVPGASTRKRQEEAVH
jgi:hypothetical protein